MLNIYYIYDLPFFRDQDTLIGKLLGGWQISGATFIRTGTPFSRRPRQRHRGRRRRRLRQPVDLVGDPGEPELRAVRRHAGDVGVQHSGVRAPAAGTFGNAPRNLISNPGEQQWDIALFKNFGLGGARKVQFRAEVFNFLNHPNLGGIERRASGCGLGGSDEPELRRGSRARPDRGTSS